MKHAPRLRRVVEPLFRLLLALIVPVLALAPRRALADGAFPGSLGPLLPPDRPNEIILGTNFGIVLSEDGGQTWTYSCERMANGMTAGQYQLGPVPHDRLFGLTEVALIYTDDRACTWSKAQGLLAGKPAFDYFPDPGNPNRVWAVRSPDQADAGTNRTYSIVESTDSGATFGVTRYTAAVGDTIAGVEIARSDGNTAYLTIRSGSTLIPKIVVTRDGGANWTTRDLSSRFGTSSLRIIAVDPANPSKIFLRVTSAAGDSMAVSLDGGTSFVTPDPLSVPDGFLNSFVQLPNGTLLVGGAKLVTNVIYRSTNGGTSFQELPAPAVAGLGQRDGRVYLAVGASNNPMPDDYALGVSDDEGTTWRPLMRFDQIQAISACAKSVCQDDCLMKVNLGIWDESVCSADPSPRPVDGGAQDGGGGGTGGRAGTGGAGGGASHPDAAADAGAGPPTTAGCGCDAAAGDSAPAGIAAGVILLLAGLLARWSRRRRAR